MAGLVKNGTQSTAVAVEEAVGEVKTQVGEMQQMAEVVGSMVVEEEVEDIHKMVPVAPERMAPKASSSSPT